MHDIIRGPTMTCLPLQGPEVPLERGRSGFVRSQPTADGIYVSTR